MYPSPAMRLSTSRHASRLLEQSTMYYDAETTMTQPEVPLKDTLNEMYNNFVEAQANTTSQLATDRGVTNGKQLTIANRPRDGDATNQEHVFNLANYFEDLCSDYLRVITDLNSKRIHTDKDMHLCSKLETMLREERNSWRLARAIFKDYLIESPEMRIAPKQDDYDLHNDNGDCTIEMEQDMPPMSDQQLIDLLYQRNHLVRRMQLVTDWLETNEADDLSYQSQTDKAEFYTEGPTAWENTFHAMRTRSMAPNMTSLRHGKPELCGAMDPDAPIRTKKPLADQDKEDEYRMFKHVFKFVRAGKLEEAQEVAIKVGYNWFAAALDGWLPYSDPNFDTTPTTDLDDSASNAGAIKPITGNKKCDVWKLTCYKTAQMHGLAPYEKAILGVFGGNLKSVLPVCSRWSDQLWARLKSAIDVIIVKAIQNSSVPTLDNQPRTTSEYPDAYYDNFQDLAMIFETIEAQKLSASSREASIHQTVQKYFILNDMDGLLAQMVECSQQLDFEECNPDTVSPHYLRFFAHVVLFLRDIGFVRHDDRRANEILQAYISHLTQLRHIESVAFYTSALPKHNQILSYAKLLKTVTEKEERKFCLRVANDAKLDVDAITQAVVELIRKEPASDTEVPLTDTERELLAKTTPRDHQKIQALDWLLYTGRPNYVAIIHQGNALMRSFALERKLDAVYETFSKLPIDLYEMVEKQWRTHTNQQSVPVDLENDRREYMCFRLQLEVRDAISAWSDYHRRKPEEPRKPTNINKFCDSVGYEQKMKQYHLDLCQWIEHHKTLAGDVAAKIVDLFNYQGGWFIDLPTNEQRIAAAGPDGNAADESQDYIVTLVVSRSESQVERRRQLARIRKFYIPQLVIFLYNVLHLSEQYKDCLNIADLVADEATQLYKEFDQEQLKDFLEKMRLASLCILKTCPDPLGYTEDTT